MNTKRLPLLMICFIGFSLTSQSALAETVYVAPTIGTGGAATEDLATLSTLVANAVTENGSNSIVAKSEDAEISLSPKMSKLGKAYIVSISRQKGGVTDFSTSLRAEQIEELDKIATRLTQAALKGVKASETAQVDNVTENEATQGTLRKAARKSRVFSLGPVFFSKLNTDGVGTHIGLEKSWEIKYGSINYDIFNLEFRGSVQTVSTGFGMDYFFTQSDVSPYVGGKFGLGILNSPDHNLELGFLFGADAGIRLMRTSSIGIDLSAKASWLTTTVIPGVYVIQLGLVF